MKIGTQSINGIPAAARPVPDIGGNDCLTNKAKKYWMHYPAAVVRHYTTLNVLNK